MYRKISSYLNKKYLSVKKNELKKEANKVFKSNNENSDLYLGSQNEFQEISNFWKKFDLNVDIKWYKYYSYPDSKFNKNYIPADIFDSEINEFLNLERFDDPTFNSIYSGYILQDVNQAKTIIRYANGFFVNENIELISRDKALSEIQKYETIIFKPSKYDSEYEMMKLKISETNNIKEVFEKYINIGEFVVYNDIGNSKELMNLSDSEEKIIRVRSLVKKDRIEIVSSILIHGDFDSIFNNFSQKNFYSRPILLSGMLADYEFYENNIKSDKLDVSELSVYKKIVDIITKVHARMVDIRLIGWNFAIDENENPILISIGDVKGDEQRVSGPILGDNIEEILTEIFTNRNIGG